jgi:ATP-dependent DNA helicase RecG
VNADITLATNSTVILAFLLDVVATAEPEPWLRKQQVIQADKPTVAGIVLFAEEPQASLPKRSGIKIYRYKTAAAEGTRDTRGGETLSIEGHGCAQIGEAVKTTAETIQAVRVNTPEGLESVKYPITALHEIITNAVLHRDYSVADDIHIRIFDNRVEVASPGTLPAHITPENILNERFATNATIVPLINKFPDPPNKRRSQGDAFQKPLKHAMKNHFLLGRCSQWGIKARQRISRRRYRWHHKCATRAGDNIRRRR